jgi:hypothetical protein
MFLDSSSTTYGEREGLVQKFYESLPELWTSDQENPYIWGNYSHYQSWWIKPDAELLRRRYATIEWCYCPFRRSGDIYGAEVCKNIEFFREYSIIKRTMTQFGRTLFVYKENTYGSQASTGLSGFLCGRKLCFL